MVYVLVENLPRMVIEKDIDELLSRFGRVTSMHIKFPSRDAAAVLAVGWYTLGRIPCNRGLPVSLPRNMPPRKTERTLAGSSKGAP
jgi:hypothetical protein